MKDGLCAKVCPVRIFDAKEREVPAVRRADECVLCGQCLAVCSHDAIRHSRLDPARFVRIENREPVGAQAALALLRQRRSVRAYKTDEVPRDLLERIAGVAAFAPTSAHGRQGWVRSVTIVAGKEDMLAVRDLTAEYMRELRNLLGSTVVGWIAKWKIEPRRGRAMLHDLDMRLSELAQGRDAILYEAPAAIFVHTPEMTNEPWADCDAALYAMMIAAQAHGLGTCWNGWLAKAGDAFKARRSFGLRRMLGVPADHVVGAAMTIGYPGIKLHSVPQRETRVVWAGGAAREGGAP